MPRKKDEDAVRSRVLRRQGRKKASGVLWKISESGVSTWKIRPKRMLKYCEDSEDLKVGLSELKDQLENAGRNRFFCHVDCQTGSGMKEAKSSWRFSVQGENEVCIASLAR